MVHAPKKSISNRFDGLHVNTSIDPNGLLTEIKGVAKT